jgi:hypothetical protein
MLWGCLSLPASRHGQRGRWPTHGDRNRQSDRVETPRTTRIFAARTGPSLWHLPQPTIRHQSLSQNHAGAVPARCALQTRETMEETSQGTATLAHPAPPSSLTASPALPKLPQAGTIFCRDQSWRPQHRGGAYHAHKSTIAEQGPFPPKRCASNPDVSRFKNSATPRPSPTRKMSETPWQRSNLEH